MHSNLQWRLSVEDYQPIAEGVFAKGEVEIHSMTVLNADAGPILLEDGVKIGPFAVIRGPAYLGANSKIAPHSLLKGSVSIGHTCKVGGEVSQTVIEPYTNKSHYGYLGTSYVGSWVNLGAGTTNSNLKNTYGTIRLEVDGEKLDTGLQFLGCVIGDYSNCLLYTSPSPRDATLSRMPSSA